MGTFSAMHARVHRLVTEKGAPIAFSRLMTDSYDPLTDEDEPYTATMTGVAMRKDGDPMRYQALGLIPSEAATLDFVPDTEGELPSLGASTQFGGADYVVRDVDPIAPAGVAILARVIVAGGGVERLPTNEHVASETSEVVGSETDGVGA